MSPALMAQRMSRVSCTPGRVRKEGPRSARVEGDVGGRSAAGRASVPPEQKFDDVGFRCAIDDAGRLMVRGGGGPTEPAP